MIEYSMFFRQLRYEFRYLEIYYSSTDDKASYILDESGPSLRFVGDFPSRARRLPRIRWLSNEFALFECSLNGRNFTVKVCGKGMQ